MTTPTCGHDATLGFIDCGEYGHGTPGGYACNKCLKEVTDAEWAAMQEKELEYDNH